METEAVLEDPVLGKLIPRTNGLGFTFSLPRKRQGRGTFVDASPEKYPSEEWLIAVRKYIAWFRPKEVAFRAYIAEQCFPGWLSGWYDPEIDRTRTQLGFQRKINLSGINFYWDEDDAGVSVIYNDGGLFGNHGLEVATDYAGNIRGKPLMFG